MSPDLILLVWAAALTLAQAIIAAFGALPPALQAEIVSAQVALVGERRRCCPSAGTSWPVRATTPLRFARCSAMCRYASDACLCVLVRDRLRCRASAYWISVMMGSHQSWPTSRPGMPRGRRSARLRSCCPS